jgi:predicted Zn finger-like uncharacterized protein
MSLITQCPQCFTAFHVAAEQFRAAQGWVRCGLCKEVFSAQAHALPEIPSAELVRHQEPLRSAGDESPPPKTALKRSEALPGITHRTRGRSTWIWLASAAMVFLFLLQLGVAQRQHLAVEFPVTASWLQSLCGVSQACSLRDIRNISIKDANFEAVDANHFKLSAALTNVSVLHLQAPSLALDFTDSSDGIVARKSFGPKEWGALADTLPGQTVWPVILWIEIDLPTDGPPVAGYRLKAFYP